MAKAKPIPDGYHSVTPYLVVKGAAAAIDFYKKAFGATELVRMPMPGGKIGHAEIKIGNSPVMLADESPVHGAHRQQHPSQRIEQGDVAARLHRQMNVRHRGCGRPARIDHHDLLLGPGFLAGAQAVESHRVRLRHVAAHDQNSVAIHKVLWKGGGSAAS